jgi:outer membrane protein OmpA-like peptidoglycan-associated protein
MISKRFLSLCSILAISFGLACAGGLPGLQPIPLTANPSEQIQGLASEISAAQEHDVDVLAPTWFGRSRASLQEAKELLARGDAVQAILQNVAEGRAELQQAESFAKVTAQAIGPAIRARGDARTAGAVDMTGYAEAERDFRALGAAVESDRLATAKRNTSKVERTFRELELAAIKQNAMGRIADLIERAKRDGAAELAPQTLAAARGSYRELDSYITKNRYAREETAARVTEALFAANRLVHVTQEAKAAQGRTPEQAALNREGLVSRFGSELSLPDLRNQSAEAQIRGVEHGIRQMAQDRDFLNNRVELLRAQAETQQGRISLLEGQSEAERRQIAQLEAQRRFNDRFAEVSAQFSGEEAEVYKKDRSLVIRLRSIDFPVGSTVVLPNSYPLMAKVQRAIRSFDDPLVIIEGHTDSTGSTEVNDRISQARADAVKAYLVANNTVGEGRVTAVGKGFGEPLASDRTVEGRAQNRRIDIIIDAHEPDLDMLPSVAEGPPAS